MKMMKDFLIAIEWIEEYVHAGVQKTKVDTLKIILDVIGVIVLVATIVLVNNAK